MIQTFRDRSVASSLEPARICTQQNGGVMVRGWCRSAERRRGVWTILSAVAAALPGCNEARHLRERFECELRELLQARDVELRDGSPMSRPPDSTVSLEVSTGDLTLGAIDLVFEHAGRRFDDWERELIQSARELAAVVLIVDRVQRAGGLGAVGTASARSDGAAPIVGSSPGIRAVRARIERVAATGFTVLIQGESGVGKELVARQIHDLSPRRDGPFVAVNCAAIVETLLEAELFGIEDRIATGVRGRRGKFESAHGGTLFLDEVADLSQSAQAKLLRAIQEMSVERVGGNEPREIDTRIIAATNSSLADLVARGRFRLDLYYRLHGVEIDVPPLRDRPEDILELAEYFLERHRDFRRLRLSQAASDALLAYRWPGNVRELERVIERAVALADSDQLRLDDLPPALLDGYVPILMPSFQRCESMRAWGSRYARMVLERCQQNKRQACRELGISYHTLQSYLRFRPQLVAGSPPAKKAGAGRTETPQRSAPLPRSEGVPW
jgi:DNA-binding NtrC family response regulator